jgi:regulator of protease activity HflC (stomatin/prohibitin superfamily)
MNMENIETRESESRTVNGWLMIIGLFVAGLLLGFWGNRSIDIHDVRPWRILAWAVATGFWIFLCFGFFTLQPNIAGALILFGRYKGTVRVSGFHWVNPLLQVKRVSLRAHNLNGETLKVNDSRGNPIEISCVVVWRVVQTAKAIFDVEDYAAYVTVQSEAALRHLAMSYPYDTFEGDTLSLRGSVDEISAALRKELQERVTRAGVLVEEARISHLAYAPEIAGEMLRRQQADAIVAARQRIVDGAVGMVEMALHKLQEKHTIELDEERKAAMVSNLLVVLCGDRAAHPVVNTGTLYT